MDDRDLKILEILARNCRTSPSVIGKALHLSKDAVRHRVEVLKRERLLNPDVLFIDARRLGYTRFHILISFDSPPGNIAELSASLAAHPYVMWINTFIGSFDVQIIVDARDGFHLDQIRRELFSRVQLPVRHYTILTHLSDLEFTQIPPVLDLRTTIEAKADASFTLQLAPQRFPVSADFRPVRLSAPDPNILQELASDPSLPLIEIERRTGIDRQTIRRRILSLIDQQLILSFGGVPNVTRLGYVTYYLLVRLTQDPPPSVLQSTFAQLHNIFYAGRMIGDYDLLLYLNARTPQELSSSLSDFHRHLSGLILNRDLLVQDRVWHWRQYTPGIHSDLTARRAAPKAAQAASSSSRTP